MNREVTKLIDFMNAHDLSAISFEEYDRARRAYAHDPVRVSEWFTLLAATKFDHRVTRTYIVNGATETQVLALSEK